MLVSDLLVRVFAMNVVLSVMIAVFLGLCLVLGILVKSRDLSGVESVFDATRFTLPAQPALTTSEEYWRTAGVVWMEESFKNQFLDLEVPRVSGATFAFRSLAKPTLSALIVDELKGKAPTSVSQVRAFMRANRHRMGHFLTFAVGKDGNLRALDFSWSNAEGRNGFSIGAYPIAGPVQWPTSYRVFYRIPKLWQRG